jgi:hypothetical protein
MIEEVAAEIDETFRECDGVKDACIRLDARAGMMGFMRSRSSSSDKASLSVGLLDVATSRQLKRAS